MFYLYNTYIYSFIFGKYNLLVVPALSGDLIKKIIVNPWKIGLLSYRPTC